LLLGYRRQFIGRLSESGNRVMDKTLPRRSAFAAVEALESRSLLSASPGTLVAMHALDSAPTVHSLVAERALTAQSTTTTIHTSKRVVKVGQLLRVTITVKSAGRKTMPAGAVEIIDNGQTLPLTLTLSPSGRASYSLEVGNLDLFPGNHALTALYTSSNSLFGSTSKTVFVSILFPKIKKRADGLGTGVVQAGHGKAAVHAGQTATVLYTGYLQSNGEVFDYATSPSHGAGAPPNLTFVVQASPEQVITGFDEGVAGMKVGEIRALLIPAALGYGPNGSGDGSVPPNNDLLFLVKLQSIT
jgi:FKBP-type peptidyl-prolyl cis-trans isomerase FkpA